MIESVERTKAINHIIRQSSPKRLRRSTPSQTVPDTFPPSPTLGYPWRSLVQIYGPLVYRLCRVAGIPAEDAQDIGQEVFRGVVTNLDRFQYRQPGDSFRAWLLGIIRNKIRDYFRQHGIRPAAVGGSDMQRQIQEVPDLDWSTSDDGTEFDSDSSTVHRAIGIVRNEFEDRTWEAFWKVAIEGHAPKDIAQDLGVSNWAVYQAKSRVSRRLRLVLQGLQDQQTK